MGADQGDDQPGHQQHVDRVEARDRGGPDLRAGRGGSRRGRGRRRAGGGDVVGDDRGPVGALVEGQQVAGQAHHQGEDQQHHADHPVELARVLVGAEEEGPPHVEEDQDDHHRGAPLVHPADELAEEDVVGQVGDRPVGLGRRGRVVHRQEDAGDRLDDEGEQGRRAERVEPVGPLRHLAEEHPGEEAAAAGALVDPADDVGAGLLGHARPCRRRAPLPLPSPGSAGRLAAGRRGVSLSRIVIASPYGGGGTEGRGG